MHLLESIYISYLEFFCRWDLSVLSLWFIYSVTCLYQYGLMNIYFILGVITQYYLILLLNLFQLWLLRALSVGVCVTLIYLHHCGMDGWMDRIWNYKMFQEYLLYFLPQVKILNSSLVGKKASICGICCLLLLLSQLSHVQLFWDPMNCNPLDSSIHGISQARIVECVTISCAINTSLLPVSSYQNAVTVWRIG